MPTLTDHASLEVAWLVQRDTEARNARAVAQADLTAAKQTLDAVAKIRREARAAADETRKQLGNAEVAPDATGGGEQLRADLELLRSARRDELEAHVEVEHLTALLERTTADAVASKQALDHGRQRQQTAEATRKTIVDWTAALSTAPLSSLVADATALRDDTVVDGLYAKAKTQIEDNLPAALRDLASARLLDALAADEAARAYAEELRKAYDGIDEANGGVAGALPGLEHELERSLARLGDYVKFGVARRDRAKALLETVIARGALAAAVHDSLREDQTNRNTAAGLALDVVTARGAVRTATYALELHKARGTAADPDFVPPSSGTEVDDLAAATANLTSANTAYGTPSQELVAKWEVDVPAWAWTQLAEFVIATKLLDELKVAPTGLATAVTTAEDDLANKRIELLEIQKSVALTRARVDTAQLAVDVGVSTVNERHRGALEGLR